MLRLIIDMSDRYIALSPLSVWILNLNRNQKMLKGNFLLRVAFLHQSDQGRPVVVVVVLNINMFLCYCFYLHKSCS